MRRVAFALLLVFAVISTRAALAGEPTRKQRKRAAALIRDARQAKKMGDRYAKNKRLRKRAMQRYRNAALAYRDAYELVELPQIVFELAEVYDARGEKRWARRGYRRYLELEPDGDDAGAAAARIEELDEEIDAGEGEPGDERLDPTSVFGEEAAPEPEPEPEPDEDAGEDADEDAGTGAEPEPDPLGAAPAPKDEPPKPGRNLRWGGIAAGGAGVLFLGLGIKYGMDASSAADELSNKQGPWTEEDRKRIADGESANNKMLLFTVLGAASVAAGGVLYYYGLEAERRGDRKDVALVPAVAPDGATLSIVGRF